MLTAPRLKTLADSRWGITGAGVVTLASYLLIVRVAS